MLKIILLLALLALPGCSLTRYYAEQNNIPKDLWFERYIKDYAESHGPELERHQDDF